MENALNYLIEDLSSDEKDRFKQWKQDAAGCDLISFMDGLDSHEPLIWALQEVYLAQLYKEEYARRMEVVSSFSKVMKDLRTIPHM